MMICGICFTPINVGGMIPRTYEAAEAVIKCSVCKREYKVLLTVSVETQWTPEETKIYLDRVRSG